ncbi:hypothetical protein KR222_007451, partial [Zaprionus bogoriensis]
LADAPVVFKSTNIECEPNPKYMVNVTCKIKARNWNNAVVQIDADLATPLRNTSIHLEVFKKGYNNRYFPFLVDVTFNICDVLSKRNSLSYGKIMTKLATRFSNVNHSCPYTGHLFARDLYIDEHLLPSFPLGFYRLLIHLMENFADKPFEDVGRFTYYVQAMEFVKRKEKTTPKKS